MPVGFGELPSDDRAAIVAALRDRRHPPAAEGDDEQHRLAAANRILTPFDRQARVGLPVLHHHRLPILAEHDVASHLAVRLEYLGCRRDEDTKHRPASYCRGLPDIHQSPAAVWRGMASPKTALLLGIPAMVAVVVMAASCNWSRRDERCVARLKPGTTDVTRGSDD
ncbi:MAG: hypothetical protein QM736_02685 [Vicinamibacterales bacterium]